MYVYQNPSGIIKPPPFSHAYLEAWLSGNDTKKESPWRTRNCLVNLREMLKITLNERSSESICGRLKGELITRDLRHSHSPHSGKTGETT